jgi:transposase-like protein
MSTKIFTEKERELLSHNDYIKTVSIKSITYTDEFKRIFIAENEKGKFPREIFEEHGFDINILGMERVKTAGKRWRAAYRENGISGLHDSRKDTSGRPREKDISLEEKYLRLEAQNNLLKAENELLKKIDMIERGLRRKK